MHAPQNLYCKTACARPHAFFIEDRRLFTPGVNALSDLPCSQLRVTLQCVGNLTTHYTQKGVPETRSIPLKWKLLIRFRASSKVLLVQYRVNVYTTVVPTRQVSC